MDRRTFVTAAGGIGLASLLGTGTVAAAEGDGYTREEHNVESFDGTEIPAVLFVPDGGADAALLTTHGWGGSKSSVEGYGPLATDHGYALVAFDQRGFGESTAEVGLSGPKEVADVSALIDFLRADDRIDNAADGEPNIGMLGASYAGGIQLNAAAVDDRIDALVPVVPWHDLAFSLVPNGVPKLGWTTLLYGSGIAASRGVESPDPENLQRGVSPRLHEIYTKTVGQNRLPPEGESFLKVRSTVSKADRIDTPALVVQGLPDTLFTPNEGHRIVETLRNDGVDSRFVLFNGGHTATETTEPTEQVEEIESMAISWFDQHLRDDGDSGIASLTYWDIQNGEFREANGFPPSDAESLDVSLSDIAGEGQSPVINTAAPTSTSHFSPENTDAVPASVAEFDLTIGDDIEVLGTPELSLSVTLAGARAFLFGKLYHVSDGEATLLNNQVAPVAIEGTPGESRTVEFELVGTQRHLESGDTLRLALAATDAGFTSARTGAGVLVDHAGSTLTLPVRSDESGGDDDDEADTDATVTRSGGSTVFTGGSHHSHELNVEGGPTFVRDRTPDGWVVVDADHPYERTAPPETTENYIEFRGKVADDSREYLTRAPAGVDQSNVYTFGPVEVSDDGTEWRTVSGTERTVLLVGADV
jgi:ABC-2 type transport system ATP-binding protein